MHGEEDFVAACDAQAGVAVVEEGVPKSPLVFAGEGFPNDALGGVDVDFGIEGRHGGKDE